MKPTSAYHWRGELVILNYLIKWTELSAFTPSQCQECSLNGNQSLGRSAGLTWTVWPVSLWTPKWKIESSQIPQPADLLPTKCLCRMKIYVLFTRLDKVSKNLVLHWRISRLQRGGEQSQSKRNRVRRSCLSWLNFCQVYAVLVEHKRELHPFCPNFFSFTKL